MSMHSEDYKAAAAKALVFVNTKPGLAAVGFVIGLVVGRLLHG